jgi:SpoVK/Ycf46/Vps4 family AAA+-type ATPase
MQDRTSEAFVIATCNDVNKLPPELLRKGRFDEIFAVDLPTEKEREEILVATLRQHGRGNAEIDVPAVAGGCIDFTGSEIASLVPDALFRAFADQGREITTDDLLIARSNIVPLAKTMSDQINALRKFQREGRARPASTPLTAAAPVVTRKGRNIDI